MLLCWGCSEVLEHRLAGVRAPTGFSDSNSPRCPQAAGPGEPPRLGSGFFRGSFVSPFQQLSRSISASWDLWCPADSPDPGKAQEDFSSCVGGYFRNKVFAGGWGQAGTWRIPQHASLAPSFLPPICYKSCFSHVSKGNGDLALIITILLLQAEDY